ncbi:MAG: outer membrane protein [Kordiimonas sp.]
MKLKTALIAATAIVATTATTATFAQDDYKFDGIYGGIEAGLDFTKLANDAKRDRSLYWGGVLGYRVQMDSGMVFGLEGTFGDSGYKNNALGKHTDYEYGGSLILGSAFGEDGSNLFYGKVGYVRARFDETGVEGGTKHFDGGWRFGAGYEKSLSQNISLRLGVDYTTYNKDDKQWQGKTGLLFKF